MSNDDYREIIDKMRGKAEPPKIEIPEKGKFDYLPVWLKPQWAVIVLLITFIGDRLAGLGMVVIWLIWLIGWNYIIKPRL